MMSFSLNCFGDMRDLVVVLECSLNIYLVS